MKWLINHWEDVLIALGEHVAIALTALVIASVVSLAIGIWAAKNDRVYRVVIVAGLRIAAVTVISVTVVGAYVNAGGLGTLIFSGMSNDFAPKIWTGAITACALAVAADLSLARLETRLKARAV